MKRRAFIAGLGVAAAWSMVVRAQQAGMPVIGYLGSGSSHATPARATFHQGLKEVGVIEGQNVAIEYRWANNQYDRLPELAADLVKRKVDVIAVPPPVAAALAAKAATQTIPIVFFTAADPVSAGLVSAINRPNGNVTGVAAFDDTLGPKNLELIHELIPTADLIAVMFNRDNPGGNIFLNETTQAARTLNQQLMFIAVKDERDIDSAFDEIFEKQIKALLLWPDTFLFAQRERIITRAAHHQVAVVSDLREFPAAGGLASYGADLTDLYRLFGNCVGKMVKGAKPADVPVLQPTKFELVVNVKAARALGLTIPPTLLARADEVIE